MGRRSVRLVAERADSDGRRYGRCIRAQTDVSVRRDGIRGRLGGCGFAVNIRELVIARAVQGFGAAFLVPGSLSIISASFAEKAAWPSDWHMVGLHVDRNSRGTGCGRMVHRTCVVALGVFHECAARGDRYRAFGLAGSGKQDETESHIDWIGALLVTAGLAGVTYGFIESANRGWKSRRFGER